MPFSLPASLPIECGKLRALQAEEGRTEERLEVDAEFHEQTLDVSHAGNRIFSPTSFFAPSDVGCSLPSRPFT